MNKNKVYKVILTKKTSEIDIETFLLENYNETIKGIFDALYDLLKDYNKNKKKIEFLLSSLERSIIKKQELELETFAICCLEFEARYSDEFTEKNKKQIVVPCQRIKKMEDIIYSNSPNVAKIEKSRLLEYLVFEDKNISRIKILLENCSNIIKLPNCVEQIILKLFDMIATIDSNSMQLEYYIHVTMLLLSKMPSKMIQKNKHQYLDILNSSPNRKTKYIKNIVSVIKGEYKENISALECEFNIKIDYPEEIANTSYSFKPVSERRINLLEQNIISIDSANTTRIDDGIFIQSDKDGGFTLYGHIADIPAVIPQFSIIDEVARQNAENIYLSDGVVHIYPDFVACNLASLLPNNKRNVISYKIKLDDQMNPLFDDFELQLSKIAVKRKMDYQEVSARLQQRGNGTYDRILKLLFLYSIKSMKKDNIDVQYFLSHPDKLQDLIRAYAKKHELGLSQLLIQEPMKTINYFSAKLASDFQIPYLYKNYNEDTAGLDDFHKFLYENPLLYHDENLVARLERTFTSSYYTATPEPFNGYECYSGSTDPLWKYSDAYNQYLIHKYLFGSLSEEEIDTYRTNQLVKHLNQRISQNKEFQRAYEIDKALIKKGAQLRKKVKR